jgi:hypothetical protein
MPQTLLRDVTRVIWNSCEVNTGLLLQVRDKDCGGFLSAGGEGSGYATRTKQRDSCRLSPAPYKLEEQGSR